MKQRPRIYYMRREYLPNGHEIGDNINTEAACCANITNGIDIAELAHCTEALVPAVWWYRQTSNTHPLCHRSTWKQVP